MTDDPLATILNDHIWYSSTTRSGQRPCVKCKCLTEFPDTVGHAEHVARIARNFLAAEVAE